MTMNSLKLSLLCATTLIITLIHLLSPVICSNQNQPSDTTRGLLFEGKTRLGSTPPSCHNKCNQCHPCLAVQVPTLPLPTAYLDSSSSISSASSSYSSNNNKYSNYKPLGWKCRCGDHFFNP
ncbi:hypothetical protein ACSBR2_024348 [Camellia fascicularis]